MNIEIITKEDLYNFKTELFEELKNLIHSQPDTSKKWLKSTEVRRMLKISPGTLQNLRVNGSLPFTKIGGVIYYASEDIIRMMEKNHTSKK